MSQRSQEKLSGLSPSENFHPQSSSKISSSQPRRSKSKSKNEFLRVEAKISQLIFKLRDRKIQLLQKINYAVSSRIEIEEKVKQRELKFAGKIQALKQQKQKKMMERLQQYEFVKAKLDEELRRYQKRKFQVNLSQNKSLKFELELSDYNSQFQLAQNLVSLIEENEKERVLVQQLELQTKEGLAFQDTDGTLESKLIKLKEEKVRLNHQLSEESRLDFSLNNKKLQELKSVINSIQIQNSQNRQQIEDIYHRLKYTQQTTEQLQAFLAEEQLEKAQLYEDLKRLKLRLAKMRHQNTVIESLLAR